MPVAVSVPVLVFLDHPSRTRDAIRLLTPHSRPPTRTDPHTHARTHPTLLGSTCPHPLWRRSSCSPTPVWPSRTLQSAEWLKSRSSPILDLGHGGHTRSHGPGPGDPRRLHGQADAGYYLDLVLPRFEEPGKKTGSQCKIIAWKNITNKVISLHAIQSQSISKFTSNISKNTSKFTSNISNTSRTD